MDKIDLHVSDIPRFAALFAAQRLLHPEGHRNFTEVDIRDFYTDCLVAAEVMRTFAGDQDFVTSVAGAVKTLPSGQKE